MSRLDNIGKITNYQKEVATGLILLIKEAHLKIGICKIRGYVTTVNRKGVLDLDISFYQNKICIFSGTIKNNDTFYLKVNGTIDVFRDIDIFKAFILNEGGIKKLKEGE